jgi:hypothetical protein
VSCRESLTRTDTTGLTAPWDRTTTSGGRRRNVGGAGGRGTHARRRSAGKTLQMVDGAVWEHKGFRVGKRFMPKNKKLRMEQTVRVVPRPEAETEMEATLLQGPSKVCLGSAEGR